MINKYEYKYNKYKNKYLKLKSSQGLFNDGTFLITDPDINFDIGADEKVLDATDVSELITPEDTNPPYWPTEDTKEEKDTTFIYDAIPLTTPEAITIHRDIGKDGLARGKFDKLFDMSSSDFTSLNNKSKKKILKLDTLDDFDNFTEKYAYIKKFTDRGAPSRAKIQDLLLIRWDKVANDYAGLYINEGLEDDRLNESFYKGKTYDSWWLNDLKSRDVLIFEPKDFKVIISKSINKPFKAKIYNENEISKAQYIDIHKKPNKKYILKLDNLNSFDKFTNAYGFLKNKNEIEIDWKKVKRYYAGIYVDKDSEIYDTRLTRAYLDGDKYKGWLKDNLKKGFVYVFNKKN